MSWATISETEMLTGATVTQPELEMAQAIIEVFAGFSELTTDAGRVSSKNRRLLRNAVAWQVVFMQEHPDIFTAMDISEMSEGSGSGMSITLGKYGVFLAPLAGLCIGQLSWKATRSIRVRPRDERARRRIEEQSRDRYEDDGYPEWESL